MAELSILSKYNRFNFCRRCEVWKNLLDYKLDALNRKICTECSRRLRSRPHNPRKQNASKEED
jgi:hypothetical protein